MQDFQFYVTDDRYAVPTLALVQTKDAITARHLANRLLDDRHHFAVEVWANDQRLFKVGRAAAPASDRRKPSDRASPPV